MDLLSHPERICETERHKEICVLKSYYDGTQYDGRPDWWTGLHRGGKPGEEVPLRERKPIVIYALPKTAVNQAVRFTVGEGRFPTIKVEAVKPDEALSPELALTDEEAKTLTDYVGECVKSSLLKSAMRAILRQALSQRTAVGIVTVKRGKFVIESPRAQDCYAVFADDDPSADVSELRWCFPFQKEVEDHGRTVSKTHFYRRDVTADRYVVYDDALSDGGKVAPWRESKDQPKPHNYGFCPVAWMRNLPESFCGDVDGVSIYDGLEDEFDALNFTLSQRHRGIHYYGTPQAYETGVSDAEKPAGPPVRRARPDVALKGKHPLGHNDAPPVKADPFGVNDKPARRIAPDAIWSYESPEARPGLIETSGKAFEVASKHVDDIRGRLLETMSVIIIDAATMQKSDLSGVALARLCSPMLSLVDELREHWWEHGIAKLISLMLRITAVTNGEGIYIPGARKAADILARFQYEHAEGVAWIAPTMTPLWGDYFPASNAEVKEAVDAMARAREARLVTPKTATAYVASYVGVDDAEAEADEANEDAVTSGLRLTEARAKNESESEPTDDDEPEPEDQ